MTKYDDIYEIAADNYGPVTSSDAASIGVARSELTRYANSGRLERRGRAELIVWFAGYSLRTIDLPRSCPSREKAR